MLVLVPESDEEPLVWFRWLEDDSGMLVDVVGADGGRRAYNRIKRACTVSDVPGGSDESSVSR